MEDILWGISYILHGGYPMRDIYILHGGHPMGNIIHLTWRISYEGYLHLTWRTSYGEYHTSYMEDILCGDIVHLYMEGMLCVRYHASLYGGHLMGGISYLLYEEYPTSYM
ncbi:hypothetical protein CDAR_69611 [Caerostris darwini]|uniref:Cellulase n=1 Tax=Caerostris darwini TaxID=1538125 RepID=A0AAV4U0P6_9ARAC|nr:hypothetical protein CDAR_69611 [Caerostris darwini]